MNLIYKNTLYFQNDLALNTSFIYIILIILYIVTILETFYLYFNYLVIY